MSKISTDKRFTSYKEFYPFYLSQHANTTCRRLHYVGTTLVLAILAYAIYSTTWWLIATLPVCGYFFAWVGHFGFEKNRPATFTYPVWSLMGDFQMYWDAITRQLDRKMNQAVAMHGYSAAAE